MAIPPQLESAWCGSGADQDDPQSPNRRTAAINNGVNVMAMRNAARPRQDE